jgi:hypothetical protein
MQALGGEENSSYSWPRHQMWVSVLRHSPAALYPRERTLSTHRTGSWAGLIATRCYILQGCCLLKLAVRMDVSWGPYRSCDGGCTYLWNVGILWDDKVLYPTRLLSSLLYAWEYSTPGVMNLIQNCSHINPLLSTRWTQGYKWRQFVETSLRYINKTCYQIRPTTANRLTYCSKLFLNKSDTSEMP